MLNRGRRKQTRIICQVFTELMERSSTMGDGEIYDISEVVNGVVKTGVTIGDGEIYDISESGVGLESDAPFVVGQRITIRFMIEANSITLPAEIIRTEQKLMRKFYGIKFVDDSPEITQKIKEFVEKTKKEHLPPA